MALDMGLEDSRGRLSAWTGQARGVWGLCVRLQDRAEALLLADIHLHLHLSTLRNQIEIGYSMLGQTVPSWTPYVNRQLGHSPRSRARLR